MRRQVERCKLGDSNGRNVRQLSLAAAPFRDINQGDLLMMIWETPAATDLRFGFEITMYIANR
jgi:coenzyme PQQ precursor peptide PqqA